MRLLMFATQYIGISPRCSPLQFACHCVTINYQISGASKLSTKKKATKSKSVKKPVKKATNKRKSPQRKKKSPFGFILATVFVVAGLVGYAFMGNADFLDDISRALGITADADQGPVLPVDGEIIVHFLDVGQGDAALIQTPGGSVLIDGGDNHMGERVADYLRGVGISELTYIIATHPHADHIGGLVTVLDQFPVGTLIMPPVAHTTLTFERFLDAIEYNNIPLREPVVGSTFSVGDAHFTIIGPNSTGHSNLNDYSVSLRMTHGAMGFIFTGDAEAAAEREMLDAGHNVSADVLRVGHHGSSTSTTQEFLDAVNPSIAVINVGADNRYGHPHNTVLSRLRVAGVRIYRTDDHGNIAIVSNGANLSVHHD